jgi:hypothetical protein
MQRKIKSYVMYEDKGVTRGGGTNQGPPTHPFILLQTNPKAKLLPLWKDIVCFFSFSFLLFVFLLLLGRERKENWSCWVKKKKKKKEGSNQRWELTVWRR